MDVVKNFPNVEYTFGEVSRSVRGETNILKLDSTKAQNTLNWHPLYTVEEMAEETVKFIMRKSGTEVNVLCRHMIEAYLKKVEHGYEG